MKTVKEKTQDKSATIKSIPKLTLLNTNNLGGNSTQTVLKVKNMKPTDNSDKQESGGSTPRTITLKTTKIDDKSDSNTQTILNASQSVLSKTLNPSQIGIQSFKKTDPSVTTIIATSAGLNQSILKVKNLKQTAPPAPENVNDAQMTSVYNPSGVTTVNVGTGPTGGTTKPALKVKKVKAEPSETTTENAQLAQILTTLANDTDEENPAPAKTVEVGGLLAAIPEAFSKGEVRCLCKVGNRVWTAGSFGKLAIYDTEKYVLTEKRQSVPVTGVFTALCCVEIGDNEVRVWSGFESGTIAVWNPTSIIKEHEIKNCHNGAINAIIQAGKHIWTASDDMTIRIWEVLSLQPRAQITEHKAPVKCMVVVESNNQIWSAGSSNSIKIHNINDGKVVDTITLSSSDITTMCATCGKVWVGTGDGKIRIFDGKDNRILKEIKAHTLPIKAMVATVKQVWTSGPDKIAINETKTLKNFRDIVAKARKGSTYVEFMIGLSKERIWASCSDKKIRIWKAEGERVANRIPFTADPNQKPMPVDTPRIDLSHKMLPPAVDNTDFYFQHQMYSQFTPVSTSANKTKPKPSPMRATETDLSVSAVAGMTSPAPKSSTNQSSTVTPRKQTKQSTGVGAKPEPARPETPKEDYDSDSDDLRLDSDEEPTTNNAIHIDLTNKNSEAQRDLATTDLDDDELISQTPAQTPRVTFLDMPPFSQPLPETPKSDVKEISMISNMTPLPKEQQQPQNTPASGNAKDSQPHIPILQLQQIQNKLNIQLQQKEQELLKMTSNFEQEMLIEAAVPNKTETNNNRASLSPPFINQNSEDNLNTFPNGRRAESSLDGKTVTFLDEKTNNNNKKELERSNSAPIMNTSNVQTSEKPEKEVPAPEPVKEEKLVVLSPSPLSPNSQNEFLPNKSVYNNNEVLSKANNGNNKDEISTPPTFGMTASALKNAGLSKEELMRISNYQQMEKELVELRTQLMLATRKTASLKNRLRTRIQNLEEKEMRMKGLKHNYNTIQQELYTVRGEKEIVEQKLESYQKDVDVMKSEREEIINRFKKIVQPANTNTPISFESLLLGVEFQLKQMEYKAQELKLQEQVDKGRVEKERAENEKIPKHDPIQEQKHKELISNLQQENLKSQDRIKELERTIAREQAQKTESKQRFLQLEKNLMEMSQEFQQYTMEIVKEHAQKNLELEVGFIVRDLKEKLESVANQQGKQQILVEKILTTVNNFPEKGFEPQSPTSSVVDSSDFDRSMSTSHHDISKEELESTLNELVAKERLLIEMKSAKRERSSPITPKKENGYDDVSNTSSISPLSTPQNTPQKADQDQDQQQMNTTPIAEKDLSISLTPEQDSNDITTPNSKLYSIQSSKKGQTRFVEKKLLSDDSMSDTQSDQTDGSTMEKSIIPETVSNAPVVGEAKLEEKTKEANSEEEDSEEEEEDDSDNEGRNENFGDYDEKEEKFSDDDDEDSDEDEDEKPKSIDQ